MRSPCAKFRAPLSSDNVWMAPAGQGLCSVSWSGRSRPCVRRRSCSTMADLDADLRVGEHHDKQGGCRAKKRHKRDNGPEGSGPDTDPSGAGLFCRRYVGSGLGNGAADLCITPAPPRREDRKDKAEECKDVAETGPGPDDAENPCSEDSHGDEKHELHPEADPAESEKSPRDPAGMVRRRGDVCGGHVVSFRW